VYRQFAQKGVYFGAGVLALLLVAQVVLKDGDILKKYWRAGEKGAPGEDKP
jgi:hypothetical protein